MSPQGPSLSLPCMALPSPQVPPGPAASLTEPAQVSGGGPKRSPAGRSAVVSRVIRHREWWCPGFFAYT